MKKLLSLILILALSLTAVCAFAEGVSSPSAKTDILADAETENVEINTSEEVMAEAQDFSNAQYEEMAEMQNEETGNLDYYTANEETVFVPTEEAEEDPLQDSIIVKVENLAIIPMPIKNVTDDPTMKEVKITVKDIPAAAKVTLAPNEKIIVLFTYQGADGKTYYTQINYVVVLDENGEPVRDANGKVMYDFIIPIEIAKAAEDLAKATINFEKVTYKVEDDAA